MKKDSVVLLYSGGADSSYAACVLSKSFDKIHLMTYMRLGFLGEKLVYGHLEKIQKRFPQTEFIHHFINADKFYQEICYENYLDGVKKHGFMVLATCGFCKAALHWRNLIYCIDNNIKYAADGATVDSKEYIEQNPRISMPDIRNMYSHFGITHLNPVYQENLSTEEALYDLGITEDKKIKRTKQEKQIYCSQHILFAMFLRTYLSRHSFSEYEDAMHEYFKAKIQYMIKLTEEYKDQGKNSRLFKLI